MVRKILNTLTPRERPRSSQRAISPQEAQTGHIVAITVEKKDTSSEIVHIRE